GANVAFALARRAGELIARFPQYEAGVEERHHSQKKDAPSGTAIKIAAEVKEGSGGKLSPPIASSRVGAEFGLHTLFFDSADDLAEIAIDLGADGVLTITPYYNKPTPDGLRRHFGMQAAAIEKRNSGFPMIMYNVPGRTGVNMTAATTLQIASEVPNVVGVKEASGNMEQILTILRDRAKGFAVLSGDDAWTLPLIAAGADGIISVASNEVPGPMATMVAAALAGDFVAARRMHEKL